MAQGIFTQFTKQFSIELLYQIALYFFIRIVVKEFSNLFTSPLCSKIFSEQKIRRFI